MAREGEGVASGEHKPNTTDKVDTQMVVKIEAEVRGPKLKVSAVVHRLSQVACIRAAHRVLVASLRRAHQSHETLSTLGKILIGYAQVTGAFAQFKNVHWPPIFHGFLLLVRKPIELFSSLYLVPLDCVVGAHFSFYARLLGTLLLPVFCSLCFMFAAAIAIFLHQYNYARCRWRVTRFTAMRMTCARGAWVSLGRLLTSPISWSFHIWMLLVFYPMLCRNALTPFACVDVRAYSYLRADQKESCHDASWANWAILSTMFVLICKCPAGTCHTHALLP